MQPAAAGSATSIFYSVCQPTKSTPTAIPEEQAEALMAYFEHVSGENKGPQFQLQELDKEGALAAAEKNRRDER